METSSRSSEVIHAGIYYPIQSNKTRFCIKGREMLYEYCKKSNINHAKVGKWVVANKHQVDSLMEIYQRAKGLGVPVFMQSANKCRELEPLVKCDSCLVSPESGIIDSHQLMQVLESQSLLNDSTIAYNTRLTSIIKNGNVFDSYCTSGTEEFIIRSPIVVNASGLSSAEVANNIIAAPKLYFVKGHYFQSKKSHLTKRLIYPIPDKEITSLGVHLTIELSGKIKFGPDVQYLDKIDYSFNANKQDFYNSIKSYLDIDVDDLIPDYVGIRPKLQAKGGPFVDFLIENHDGFVNLQGIESPGLTSCLAIAEHVETLL